jgi:hypothetical protein
MDVRSARQRRRRTIETHAESLLMLRVEEITTDNAVMGSSQICRTILACSRLRAHNDEVRSRDRRDP